MTIDFAITVFLRLLVYSGSIYCLWRFINAFHDGTRLFEKPQDASKAKVIFVGIMVLCSLVGWAIFLQAGFERALFFLPWSAGEYNRDGEFESYRQSGSLVLALFGSLSVHSLARTIIWRNNQRHQHIELLLQKGQRDLASWWLTH